MEAPCCAAGRACRYRGVVKRERKREKKGRGQKARRERGGGWGGREEHCYREWYSSETGNALESEDSIDARDAASSVRNRICTRGFMHVPRWNVEQKKLSSCWWLFNGTSDCINKRSPARWTQLLGEDAVRWWDSIPHVRSIFDQLAGEFPVSHFSFN